MLVKLTTDEDCKIRVSDVIGKPLPDDEEIGKIRRGNKGELSGLSGNKRNPFVLEDFTRLFNFII